MYRFLFPAFLMIGAIVVLLAGALGGLPSLTDLTGEWAPYFTKSAPEHAASLTSDSTQVASLPSPTPAASTPSPTPAASTPSPTPAASTPSPTPAASTPSPTPAASLPPSTPAASDDQANQRPASDALRRQAAELQTQIAQHSRELASLQSSEDQARHELDALHQQRQTEETAISQLQAQHKELTAAPQEAPGRPQAASQSVPAPSDHPLAHTAPVPLRATAQYTRRQTPPTSAPLRHVVPQPAQTQTSQDDLANARELLVSGRPADARQLLVLAQARSELHPVTPDQPYATGRTLAATQIGDAIRLLDTGNTTYALRAINMAMDSATHSTDAQPAYPSPTPYDGRNPPAPAYYGANAQR